MFQARLFEPDPVAIAAPTSVFDKLRPYQKEANLAVFEEWKRVRGTVVVFFTGAGKTLTVIAIVERFLRDNPGSRALWLADRDFLLADAKKRIEQETGLTCSLEKAEHKAEQTRVVVGSVQTLRGRRLERFPQGSFGIIVYDECHGAVAPGSQKILEWFGAAKRVGMTATLKRHDKKGGHNVFDSVAIERQIDWGINEGYFVPILPKYELVDDIDLSGVKESKGDLAVGELDEEIVKGAAAIGNLTLKWMDDRPCIVYTPGVASAHAVCARLNRDGRNRAIAVDADTPYDGPMGRKDILERFDRGEIQFLVNCGIYLQGLDVPKCRGIVIARPTKSQSLYCLDSSTEALTPSGWKMGTELKEGDLVAGWSLTGEARWERVRAHVVREIYPDEIMVGASSPTVDMRMTDTHRMVYRPRPWQRPRPETGLPWEIKTAGRIADGRTDWEIPAAGMQESVSVPLQDDEIRFLGWVQTDGTLNKRTGQIMISQSTGMVDYCREIERVLTSCGFKWRFSDSNDATNFGPRTYPQRNYRLSRGLPRKEDKHLRGWGDLAPWVGKLDPKAWSRLEALDSHQFAILLEAWHLGDGSKHANADYDRKGYHLAISDRETADWIQSMCVRRGWRCNISRAGTVWMVHCRQKSTRSIKGDLLKPVPFLPTETVWCISVPSGAFISRRNGKAVVVGNTQMCGRGGRPEGWIGQLATKEERVAAIAASSKPNFLLLDITGRPGEHSLCSPATLAGKTTPRERELIDKMLRDDEDLTVDKALAKARQQVIREIRRQREDLARRAEQAKVLSRSGDFDPFAGYGIKDPKGYSEWAPSWHADPATEPQIAWLKDQLLPAENMTKGQASALRKQAETWKNSGRATFRQRAVLMRCGVQVPHDISFVTAGQLFDECRRANPNTPPETWKNSPSGKVIAGILIPKHTGED